jgi:hypothetical protein
MEYKDLQSCFSRITNPYTPSIRIANPNGRTETIPYLCRIQVRLLGIQSPLAIFTYGSKEKAQNLITQIDIEERNVLVGVHFNQTKNGIEINDIRGLYPKENAEWLNWVTQKDVEGKDKLLYVEKTRVQALITQQRTTLAEVSYLDLNSVTKVIQNFENPKLSGENTTENNRITRNFNERME